MLVFIGPSSEYLHVSLDREVVQIVRQQYVSLRPFPDEMLRQLIHDRRHELPGLFAVMRIPKDFADPDD